MTAPPMLTTSVPAPSSPILANPALPRISATINLPDRLRLLRIASLPLASDRGYNPDFISITVLTLGRPHALLNPISRFAAQSC